MNEISYDLLFDILNDISNKVNYPIGSSLLNETDKEFHTRIGGGNAINLVREIIISMRYKCVFRRELVSQFYDCPELTEIINNKIIESWQK